MGAAVAIDDLCDVCVVADDPSRFRTEEEQLTTGIALLVPWRIL